MPNHSLINPTIKVATMLLAEKYMLFSTQESRNCQTAAPTVVNANSIMGHGSCAFHKLKNAIDGSTTLQAGF
jgi:hypothetical protein